MTDNTSQTAARPISFTLKDKGKGLISFSGGPDSVFLVHVLTHTFPNFQWDLVYFNHHLRAKNEMIKELDFVKAFSRKKQLPLRIISLPVTRFSHRYGLSIEHAARMLRFRWLFHLAKQRNASHIATGHHFNDNIETFFLKVSQGVDKTITGLSSTQHIRLFPGTDTVALIKPLLPFTKQDILNELNTMNASYSTDSSNEDTQYRRNHLRHTLIPKLLKTPQDIEKWATTLSYFQSIQEPFYTIFAPLLQNMSATQTSYTLSTEEILALPADLRGFGIALFLDTANYAIQHLNSPWLGCGFRYNKKQIHALLEELDTKKTRWKMDIGKHWILALSKNHIALEYRR